MEGQPQQPMQIRMDVAENDDAYVVHAEIPGVEKDDINVTIDGSQITISAEVTKNTEHKGGGEQDKDKDKVLRTERYYGKIFRSFTLGQDVDEEGAEAKYNSGVLELRLPKKATATTRKLTIQ